MKTIKYLLDEMNNIQSNLNAELVRLLTEVVGNGMLRVYKDGATGIYAYAFDYDRLEYTERPIYALAVFDGELALLLDNYKYFGMSDDELLEQDEWMTLYCGEFYSTPTIENIAECISEYIK